MDCASCATKIETAIRRIDGVKDIKVGLQTETLSVTLDNANTGEKVEQAVRDLGYEVSCIGSTD